MSFLHVKSIVNFLYYIAGYAIDPSVDNVVAEAKLVGDSSKSDDNKGMIEVK